MVKEISIRSKLPIYVAYIGFGAVVWKGNAKNEADAVRRAIAATGNSVIYANKVKKR